MWGRSRLLPIAQGGYALALSDVHVVPQGDGWALEVAGDKRESFDTQDEAIRHGRELAELEQGELVTHSTDGRIREKDSQGTTHQHSRLAEHWGGAVSRP